MDVTDFGGEAERVVAMKRMAKRKINVENNIQ